MAMTMTEKILARAAGKSHVAPGENVWAGVDVLMTHDVCGPGTIGVFKKNFGDSAKVWDRDVRRHPRLVRAAEAGRRRTDRRVELR